MIDWSKLGPANSPLPSTPDTTAPVAPATPGSIPTPQAPAPVPPTGSGYHDMSQQQVDQLDPGQRIGRGIDFLGNLLFGSDENSLLKQKVAPVQALGDLFGAAGNVAHGVADLTVVKPVEGAATLASHVPLGWLPGGADENFNQIGEWAKQNDPELYQHWQTVGTAANGDVLGGGNMKADFNMQAMQYLDDKTKNGVIGAVPIQLAAGRAGIGSLGGAVSNAIQGWLGVGSTLSQRVLGGAGVFDPTHNLLDAGKLNRVEESAARLAAGGEVSDVEKQAVQAWQSGAWSMEHAQDFIVSHGQGITRNVIGQALGSVVTDPLTYATLGAGAISKAGSVGARIAEAGGEATTTYEKLGQTINAIQNVNLPMGKELGDAFRIARGLIDPFAVYKPSAVDRAVTDLRNGVALESFYRAYGQQATHDLRAIGREFGMSKEVDSAIASYSIDQANLMVARKAQKDILQQGLGEDMVHTSVDSVIDPMAQNASKDALTELTDHMMQVSKNTFTPEEEASLAGRMASTFGSDASVWAKRIEGMSPDLKSALHAVTYKRAEVGFEQARAAVDTAAYKGDLPLQNMVLMTTDTLDNVAAEHIIDNIRSILKDTNTEDRIAAATAEWNGQAKRFPAMANLGYATGGQDQVEKLVNELDKTLQSGGLSRRALDDELNDPALASIKNFLDRNTLDGKRLWNVGFRPDEGVAWGLKRDVNTGRYIIDRDPTISHVVDAVPGRQPFSDTTRNILGQVIGPSKAERLNGPIDSIEAFVNTSRDMVTGRRLVANIERRFERSTFEAGIPKPISKEIMAKAKEVAGLEFTTLRGVKPGNVWNEIHNIIPRDLVLKDGSTLNVHIVMDHLLQAAEGDLRIMGVTSVLSQRVRNQLRRLGDGSNWAGQMTVTMYNKLRYSQPMFLIQRITDAPYYSILYGVTPVGRKALEGGNAELRTIEENLGRTGLARDFSMDMPEYATRSNFTQGIKSAMQQVGLKDNRLERILRAPDELIANNMTNMLHARLGDIVKGTLDNVATIAEKADPELQAEMLQAGEGLQRSFADWREVYSQQAGRVLNDNEVGLRYVQDQLNAWRYVTNEDGTLSFDRILHEGEMALPSDVGQIGPIRPDMIAQRLGYADGAALRRDVVGHMEKINGEFQLVKGEHDLAWLEERMRTELRAHPDTTKRALSYFGGTWDDFWHGLSRTTDKGGLDISAHYAKEAQDLIAIWAKDRGMDPWEYLSGVVATNLGPTDLTTGMGRLMSFLKGGPANATAGDWGSFFRANLDPSAQQVLADEWARSAGKNATTAVPAGFTRNPHVAASGTTSTLPRDGMFHVTTAKDAVLAEGFKPSGAGDGALGFGSAGDTMNAGRVSILTNRARSQTYADRLTLAVKAARGEATADEVAAYFKPLYDKAFGAQGAERFDAVAFPATKPEDVYQLVKNLDGGLIGGGLSDAEKAVKLTAKFDAVKNIDPSQISMLELATRDKAGLAQQGLDAGELTLKPEDLHVLGAAGAATNKVFEGGDIIDMLKARAASGPHPHPDVEAVLQQISKLVQTTLKGAPAEGQTRLQLRQLVDAIPTNHASAFNRSQALVVSLLKDKIEAAQQDVFRLAEMQTKRTVLERSLNHPLFGLYPASYMWGKVLPETVKFLSKNPYAATYTIANVQRSIAIQREYDHEMDQKVNSVDRSAGAFLLDYLTPGLPWSDHQARMSPLVRDLLAGTPDKIWSDELATVSPDRWIAQVRNSLKEIPGALDSLSAPPQQQPAWAPGLQKATSAPAVGPTSNDNQQITGPTPAAALAPILQDDLTRLQSILLQGQKP